MPAYAMSVFKIPQGLCDNIERVVARSSKDPLKLVEVYTRQDEKSCVTSKQEVVWDLEIFQ